MLKFSNGGVEADGYELNAEGVGSLLYAGPPTGQAAKLKAGPGPQRLRRKP